LANHYAWSNKGITLFNLGRLEEALKAFDKAIEIKPDFADALNGKRVVLRKLGRNR
jgi:tetratricopeptide (TPR) repeat protein